MWAWLWGPKFEHGASSFGQIKGSHFHLAAMYFTCHGMWKVGKVTDLWGRTDCNMGIFFWFCFYYATGLSNL